MNTLKIQMELIKILTIVNEIDMPPEARGDIKRIIVTINHLIIDGLEKEYKKARDDYKKLKE